MLKMAQSLFITWIYLKKMSELHFEPNIEGEFVVEKDENGNEIKVIKEIKNLNSIDLVI